jgi:hypothetical protein
MLIMLSDLQKMRSAKTLKRVSSDQPPLAQLQDWLQTLIRQLHLNLPVQPFLDNDPLMHRLAQEVQNSLPNLFNPKKRVQLQTSIAAPLKVKQEQLFIQVQVNLGFKQGIPKLFEWALRSPRLNWSDRVKLWAVTNHFHLQPETLKLVVVALHCHQSAQTVVHAWNRRRHRQTQRELVAMLADSDQDSIAPSNQDAISAEVFNPALALDQIEEVRLHFSTEQ